MKSEQTIHYYINLSLDDAIEFRDSLKSAIWDIARERDLEDLLSKSSFEIKVGEPAIDIGTLITVIITYFATKSVDVVSGKLVEKGVDKVGEAWSEIILPAIRNKFGENALVEKDENTDEN
jgi:hypothetical protein